MKAVLVFATLCLAVALARPEEKYTNRYDNVNLESILGNKRLLKNYANCLINKGNCSPDGSELKRVLPEAINEDCKKCSELHRNSSRRVLLHLIEHEPEIYKQLEKQYDPSGQYKVKYCAQAKAEGLKVSRCM